MLTNVHITKAMVFPVVTYGCESWTINKAEHQIIDAFELWYWRRLLRVPWTARRSNQSILKEVNPEHTHSKYWCWSWSSNTLATWYEELTHWKRPLCWERSKAGGEEGDRGWGSWMASPMQWTWTWANSRRWWGTEKPGEWQSMVSQRIRHYLATKQQQHMPLTKEFQITWNKHWQNEGKINNSTIIF